MRIHSLARRSTKRCSSLSATLFSAWQATTQAWQPVQRSMSTTIPQSYSLDRPAAGRCSAGCSCTDITPPPAFVAPRSRFPRNLEDVLAGQLLGWHGALELGQPDLAAGLDQPGPGGGVRQGARRLVDERGHEGQGIHPAPLGPAPV